MTPKKQVPPTPEEMQAMLHRDRQERATLCRAEITAVLKKHRCTLEAEVTLRQGQIDAQVIVNARTET